MGEGPSPSGSCAAWLCLIAHSTGDAAGLHFPAHCVLLSLVSAEPCTFCTQHHGGKWQQPPSSCKQVLVRSLLLLPPVPSPAL